MSLAFCKREESKQPFPNFLDIFLLFINNLLFIYQAFTDSIVTITSYETTSVLFGHSLGHSLFYRVVEV